MRRWEIIGECYTPKLALIVCHLLNSLEARGIVAGLEILSESFKHISFEHNIYNCTIDFRRRSRHYIFSLKYEGEQCNSSDATHSESGTYSRSDGQSAPPQS